MPDRTTIVLPPHLKRLAVERARSQKMSFGEFVRRAIERALSESGLTEASPDQDPLFANVRVFRGKVPKDLSRSHDKYLYGEEE